MPMTYQEFKDYLMSSLWRSGDAKLEADLDNLIRQANSELRRRLNVEVRHGSAVLTANALAINLPDDYHSLLGVYGEGVGELTYVTPQRLRFLREYYNNSRFLAHYSIEGKSLLVSGPTSSPISITVDYVRDIPDYATTDSSWLEQEYFDLYMHAVSKQATTYLREDERLNTWIMLLNEGIDTANEDAMFNKSRGRPASKQLPRQAGIPRSRRAH